MKYFDELFNKKLKSNQNDKSELVEKNYEVAKEMCMPNFEVIANAEQEMRVLKRILEPAVKKVVKEIEEKGIEPEKFVTAIIPPEFVEE